MYAVIVGAGRVGASVAGWLVSAGHEMAVVEIDRTRSAALEEELGSVAVSGDGTDPAVLARAGAGRAEALIATTSRDDVNLVACQLARHHFGVGRTVSVVNSREHTELFELLGIDVAVDLTEMVLDRIQVGLSARGIAHLMRLSERDGRLLVAVKIPVESAADGRPIRDISLPDGTFISLVISRDGNATVPREDTLIRPGDEVVAVTTARYEEELRDLLVKRNGE